MFERPYVLAIVAFLIIPAVSVLAAMSINSINPEIAAGHSSYERNYRLLSLAKNLSMLALLLVIMGLWFLTCFFSGQVQETIVRVVALGHAWSVWIDYPDHA